VSGFDRDLNSFVQAYHSKRLDASLLLMPLVGSTRPPDSCPTGGGNGARAVEQLRLVMAELHVATVRSQVLLSLFSDFKNFSVFDLPPISWTPDRAAWRSACSGVIYPRAE
jgi:hypothetical protein